MKFGRNDKEPARMMFRVNMLAGFCDACVCAGVVGTRLTAAISEYRCLSRPYVIWAHLRPVTVTSLLRPIVLSAQPGVNIERSGILRYGHELSTSTVPRATFCYNARGVRQLEFSLQPEEKYCVNHLF